MNRHPFPDERTQKQDRILSLVCAAAAAAALIVYTFIANSGSRQKGISSDYICFYTGRPYCSGLSGELRDCEPAVLSDGCLLVSLSEVSKELGGTVTDRTVSLNGAEADAAALGIRRNCVDLAAVIDRKSTRLNSSH